VKDLSGLMKQAQEMQAKIKDAQERISELLVQGHSGGGMCTVTLKGSGELTALTIDPSLVTPGDIEIVADLVIAAHADAKRRLDARHQEIMREVAGPLAGLPGMPF
jgi:DNA-binding YbaB/EbfC family protein